MDAVESERLLQGESIVTATPPTRRAGYAMFTAVFALSVAADHGRRLLASVWDHRHNFLVRLDLGHHSQAVVYSNGDFDKIIVAVAQVADKAVICDRDGRVKVFVGDVVVRELYHSCYFQRNT